MLKAISTYMYEDYRMQRSGRHDTVPSESGRQAGRPKRETTLHLACLSNAFGLRYCGKVKA